MQTAHKQEAALLEQLRQQIAGNVVSQADEAYDRQRTPWLQVVDQHPAAIVNATNVEDISRYVRIAAREGTRPVVTTVNTRDPTRVPKLSKGRAPHPG